jgi:electron transfer flavoprotein beta subunit
VIIATFVKHVPDAEAQLVADGQRVAVDDAAFALDGMDEYGVEAAVRLKEGGVASEVVALALGPARSEAALRSALALGADRALLLETDLELDPAAQARLLAEAVRQVGATLLFVGGKQADWDSAALAPLLAEALAWPLCDWATEVVLEGPTLRALHDIDDGSEAWQAPLPVVVSTQQGLNEPRYPTLPNIMKAKRKPLERIAVSAEPTLLTVGATLPSRARLGLRLVGEAETVAAELVRRLRDEAKVV